MSNFSVADVCTGKPDSTGAPIRDVYTKVDDIYAVYQTDQRVMIQFADDQALGADQRKSLADLYITRGTINWMLDELRATGDQNRIERGHRYERRLADTLIIALQGQTQQAVAELDGLKTDLVEESKSRNRLTYLIAAAAVGLLVTAAIAFINSPIFSYHEPVAQTLWYAACIGIVGAFFSIAIAIRNRTVETGRITRDTIIDAALRILVGALAGAVLVALVKAQAFSLKLGGLEIADSGDLLSTHGKWLLVFLIALVAGFTERLVPDLLVKATASDAAAAPVRKPREDIQANERNPLGTSDGKAARAPTGTGDAGHAAIPVADPEHRPTLRRGAHGDPVRALQAAVGVDVDGIFGPTTETAVRGFQRDAGLVPDGIVGPKTWKVLPDKAVVAPASSISIARPAVPEPARLAWGKKVSAEFRRQVVSICDDLKMNPDYLMACMAFESGRTFSASKENLAGSGAIGLIQFMPTTAQALGTSTGALRAMSAEQQLAFVHKYFLPQKGKLHNLGDIYMAILWPLAVGKPDSFALFVKGQEPVRRYFQNRGLDIDVDGVVTRAEACAKVQDALDLGLKPENCFSA